MYEAIKLASLTGKAAWDDPTIWSAEETMKLATEGAEQLTGFKTGKIEEGYLADICLLDQNLPEMTPNFNSVPIWCIRPTAMQSTLFFAMEKS